MWKNFTERERRYGMSRLIDADKFCEYVDKHCKDNIAVLWKELIRRQHMTWMKLQNKQKNTSNDALTSSQVR